MLWRGQSLLRAAFPSVRHQEHIRAQPDVKYGEGDWNPALNVCERNIFVFSEFAKREDSSVLPTMDAIAATATPSGAAEWLGTPRADFCRVRSRLRQLGRCFQTGERVPRRRRPFKRRLTTRISLSGR